VVTDSGVTERVCACGCGEPVLREWVKGHHWRARREALGVPDRKVCAHCGSSYPRPERQSLKHWGQRQYCSETCRRKAAPTFVLAGPDAPGWKGDGATHQAGRKRARQMYPDAPACERCAASRSERHHKDGNPLNNARENIAFLCRGCHIRTEDRMAYRRKPMTPERTERRKAQARERQRRYRQRKNETVA
jgi:hypothetical protein